MTRRKQDGGATLVAVAVVAFFVGQCSVDLSTPEEVWAACLLVICWQRAIVTST